MSNTAIIIICVVVFVICFSFACCRAIRNPKDAMEQVRAIMDDFRKDV